MLSTSNVPINACRQYDRQKLTKKRNITLTAQSSFVMSADRQWNYAVCTERETSIYHNAKNTILRFHRKKRLNSSLTIVLFSEKIRYLPTAITKKQYSNELCTEKTGNMFINSYNSIL